MNGEKCEGSKLLGGDGQMREDKVIGLYLEADSEMDPRNFDRTNAKVVLMVNIDGMMHKIHNRVILNQGCRIWFDLDSLIKSYKEENNL